MSEQAGDWKPRSDKYAPKPKRRAQIPGSGLLALILTNVAVRALRAHRRQVERQQRTEKKDVE